MAWCVSSVWQIFHRRLCHCCLIVHLLPSRASTDGVFYAWNAVQSYDEGPRTSVRYSPFPPGGEGAPLNWRPSAVADAGNGPPFMRRPSADAVAPRLGWGESQGKGVYPSWRSDL